MLCLTGFGLYLCVMSHIQRVNHSLLDTCYCIRKNKCETNKCEKDCREINATSKNCDLATSVIMCTPSV